MASDLSVIENQLWKAADQLRANAGILPSQYARPVLGLLFLRYADERFTEIEKRIAPREGSRIKPGADDYKAEGAIYMPPEARFGHLLRLPEDANLGRALSNAMRDIEQHNPDLADVLPKDYLIRDVEYRLVLLAVDWGDLLTPYSEFVRSSPYEVSGGRIVLDTEGWPERIETVQPLPTPSPRRIGVRHFLWRFPDPATASLAIPKLAAFMRDAGLSDFVLVESQTGATFASIRSHLCASWWTGGCRAVAALTSAPAASSTQARASVRSTRRWRTGGKRWPVSASYFRWLLSPVHHGIRPPRSALPDAMRVPHTCPTAQSGSPGGRVSC